MTSNMKMKVKSRWRRRRRCWWRRLSMAQQTLGLWSKKRWTGSNGTCWQGQRPRIGRSRQCATAPVFIATSAARLSVKETCLPHVWLGAWTKNSKHLLQETNELAMRRVYQLVFSDAEIAAKRLRHVWIFSAQCVLTDCDFRCFGSRTSGLRM